MPPVILTPSQPPDDHRAATEIPRNPGHPPFPQYPFTVTELADLSGVSVRALHESCRRHLDVSPAEQLRSVRLARAHHELADTEAEQATVAKIASGWGFANPARFTADYADRYGVPPWQTLRGPAYA